MCKAGQIRHSLGLCIALLLAGCAGNPPAVTTLINCPRPPDAALAAASALPDIPEPRDAMEAIRIYTAAIAETDGIYAAEIEKRRSLIAWGKMRCGW